jgi:hypothetical protein
LFSRDGGAGLDDQGVPYLIKAMNKESLIKTNKVQKMRADRFNEACQNARGAIMPSGGNYVLNRITANEKIFQRESKRLTREKRQREDLAHTLQQELQETTGLQELNQAKMIWLTQQQAGFLHQNPDQNAIDFFATGVPQAFERSNPTGSFQIVKPPKAYENAFPEEISAQDKRNILTKMNLGSSR